MIRVLVVDDHPLFREGLAASLTADPDIRIVGDAGTAEAGLSHFARLRPDVVIIDVVLPSMNGFVACSQLQRAHHRSGVILVTSTPTALIVRRGLAVGCAGFLGKTAPPNVFRQAVRMVASGRRFIDPDLRHLVNREHEAPIVDATDHRLLNLLAQGLNNAEIAAQLHCSRGTVKNRLSRLLQRLGARGRTDLVAIASRLSVIDPYPVEAKGGIPNQPATRRLGLVRAEDRAGSP